MNRVEEVLKKWEEEAFALQQKGHVVAQHDLLERILDIRTALNDCTILRWHPASEKPERDGEYLLLGLPDSWRGWFRSFFRGEWDLYPWETFTEWAELPERPREPDSFFVRGANKLPVGEKLYEQWQKDGK